MNGIYYGAGRHTVIGPYHPDEFSARARCVAALRRQLTAEDVYEIRATSYEDARRKLLRRVTSR